MQVNSPIHSESLADILERVLNQGVVIAGDVSISLVGIELVTIKLRLLIASVDKARELGINWWAHDPALTTPGQETVSNTTTETERLSRENEALRLQVAAIESRLAAIAP